MDAELNPQFVEGQHNIIDVVPGDAGYSDLWNINMVTAPSDYVAETLKSAADVMSSGYPVQPTDILVNCPIVPPGSTTETGTTLTQGWYEGQKVYYFDYGPNPDTTAPIYALITGMDAQGNPQFVEGQHNIIDVVPGDEGYSAFWLVNLVTVPSDYVAETLKSAADVMASGYPMIETDILVNCPVINVAEPSNSQSVSIDLVAKGFAFDKSTITVPAGAMVTINFDNQDSGVSHNFAVYTDSSAKTPIFVGDVITGPKTTTYTFTAPTEPGDYFFRCDIHPTTMTGTFIVTAP
jgi:plastocyanin